MNILSLKEKGEAGNPLFGLEEKKEMKATLKDIGIGLLAGAVYFLCVYGLWIFLPV